MLHYFPKKNNEKVLIFKVNKHIAIEMNKNGDVKQYVLELDVCFLIKMKRVDFSKRKRKLQKQQFSKRHIIKRVNPYKTFMSRTGVYFH